MLIFRYLAKEVFITLIALTSILLLIFLSNQVVLYLNRAASGALPGMLVLKLMMLEMPNLLSLLLPLGFYVALLLAYGRLYADSEMIVLQACGYGSRQLLTHSLTMALGVMLITAVMMLASPMIARQRVQLLQTSGIQTLIQTIMPGRFRAMQDGQQVFYVEAMNRNHSKAKNIFLARLVRKDQEMQWDILWADQAWLVVDKNHEDFLILKNGRKYQGRPGQSNYQVARFQEYRARLPHPEFHQNNDIRAIDFGRLWRETSNPQKAAELQWRFSVPAMVIILTLLAVPLSRANPRSGKYANLLPAIVLYIIYANFMFVARDWMAAGKTPLWLGMWWLHVIFIGIGLSLLWKNKVKLA